MRSLRICLVVVLAACATAPPGSPNLERADSDLGIVAFSAAQIDPTVKLSAQFRGKDDAAAKSAGWSVLACLGTPGALILAPLCVVVGAPVGAAIGASSGAPLATLEEVEHALQAQIAATAPQRHLLHYATEYAKVSGLNGIVVLPAGKPTTVNASPTYSAGEDRRLDTIVEITLTQISASTAGTKELDYSFALTARGRLIRVRDNKVLDAFERCLVTTPRTYKQWQANDGALFKEEIVQTARELAEGFIDEWLLVYHGPPVRASPENRTTSETPRYQTDEKLIPDIEVGLVPRYALRPLYAKQEYRRYGSISPVYLMASIIKSDSAIPTLRWGAVPESFVSAIEGEWSKLHPIVYDLRLYEGSKSDSSSILGLRYEDWDPGLLVGTWYGLNSTQFTPDFPFKPCTRYHWTVRARFTLNGQTRTTEWGWVSGAEPMNARRPASAAAKLTRPTELTRECRERQIYFAIITPSTDGAECQ